MKPISARASILALAASLPLGACMADSEGVSSSPATSNAAASATLGSATAELKDRAGNVVGVATVTGEDGALIVAVSVRNLPAGIHGAHIHAIGNCSAADFTSAGGHWNPTGANHGMNSAPPHPHAGDTGNLSVADDGTGTLSGSSDGTWAGLLDEDGSAFVIHADPDDMTSQPAGNAGPRIACGVFAAN